MPFAVYDTKIGPMYVGNTEIVKAYLGNTLVYSKLPYPYSTTDIIDGLGGWNGNYTDLGNDKASVTLDNNNTITIIPSKTYVIFHDPIVDAYFKERLGVTSGEVTLAQFRTLNASTAAFTSAHRPEDYAEVTEFNEYRFLSGATVPSVGFYGCTALEEIRIPETVTAINGNDGAFRNCTSLVSIDIPSTVTTLGTYVFMGCTSLTTVTGMEGLRTIPSQAFNGCTNLVNIDLSRITSISNSSVFNGCSSLTNVDLSSATLIGIWAFQRSGLSGALSLPSIGTINQGAFQNVKNLTSVDFCHNSVTLGPYVFNGCSSLTEIRNGEGITSLANNCFQNCTSLPSFHFPYSPTTIPDNVFNGCTSLTTVTGISSAITIGNSAFYNCTSIVSLTLSNVTTFLSAAFRNCSSLESIDFGTGTGGISVGQYAFLCTSAARGSLKSFPFERVTWIGPSNENTYNQAFKYQDLTGCVVNMPNLTNTRFYDGVFAYTKIKKVMSLGSTLTTIGDTFTYCSELEEVHLPLTVTTLGNNAFGACSSLVTIDGTDNITSIGTSAFSSCSSLKSISIPLVTSLNSVFQKCGSLEYIELPSITSITVNCFQLCSSLRYADIGPGITTFGVNYAFTSCTSLEYVIIRATTPPTVGAHVFDNTNNCKFYVPYSSDHSVLAAYQSATNWSSYASRMLELDENGDIPS